MTTDQKKLRERAVEYGMTNARAYFNNRRGHGGNRPGRVMLDEQKFAAMLAMAFEAGFEVAAEGQLETEQEG